jgi:hypothetical protein
VIKRRRYAYRSAKLNKVLSNRLTVVHGVEGCDFVNAHWGHLKDTGDLVHHANAGIAVLALAQVQEGHDGTLLVLGRVAFEDLIDEFHVLLGELERDRGVVARLVAMLELRTVPVSHCLMYMPMAKDIRICRNS